MAIASPDGSAREIPVQRRCLPGRLARSYLARASSSVERAVRARRLLALCGDQILGVPHRQLAQAFDVHESQISRDLEVVGPELREIAAEENITPEVLFRRRKSDSNHHEEHHDGGGI
jgi:hypothetical protein